MDLRVITQQPFTPERFFTDLVHAIHQRRGFKEFDQISAERLWVRLIVPDDAARKQWSVGVFTGPLQIIEGPHNAPHLLTFVVPRDLWMLMSPRTSSIVERLEDYVEGPGLFIDAEHVPMLRSIRGRIDLRIDGYPSPSGPRDLTTELWLTDQEQRPDRSFTVRTSAAGFERLASGAIDLHKALADGTLKIEGDVALAMKVGAAIGRLK